MISKEHSLAGLTWLAWGTWLALAAGCTPSAATPKPPAAALTQSDAATGQGPESLRANVISTLDDPSAVAVSSAIRKVTVYSDRALVSREGTVKLTAGPTVYAFRQLPGWVDEGSVRAATTSGRIVDVRVTRSYLARANEPGYLEAEAAARQLNSRLLALDDELKVLDAESKQVEDIKAFSLDKLNKDVASGSPNGIGN